ncbi:hypothetical protein BVY00_00995 [bacterium G20]|nr:hypothetical protein BVY00_00995 [bacterium G20]
MPKFGVNITILRGQNRRIISISKGNMSKKDTTLEDIGQAITDLGNMIGGQFEAVGKRFDAVEKEQKDQSVLLEDLTTKFDKNIDKLTAQMNIKKQVNDHEERIEELESGQKTIKSVVTLHSKQLAAK